MPSAEFPRLNHFRQYVCHSSSFSFCPSFLLASQSVSLCPASLCFFLSLHAFPLAPGYGFLSENSEFAAAVERAGLMLVGPSPEVIQRMGDKVEARKAAEMANVQSVPGTNAPVNTYEEAEEVCRDIGFPVMLKAAYGGGGRGMRRVFQHVSRPKTPEEERKEKNRKRLLLRVSQTSISPVLNEGKDGVCRLGCAIHGLPLSFSLSLGACASTRYLNREDEKQNSSRVS